MYFIRHKGRDLPSPLQPYELVELGRMPECVTNGALTAAV